MTTRKPKPPNPNDIELLLVKILDTQKELAKTTEQHFGLLGYALTNEIKMFRAHMQQEIDLLNKRLDGFGELILGTTEIYEQEASKNEAEAEKFRAALLADFKNKPGRG